MRVILSSKIKTKIMTRTRADRDLPAGTILNPLSRHQQPTIDTETTEAGTECVLSRGSDLVYVDQTDRQTTHLQVMQRQETRPDETRRDDTTDSGQQRTEPRTVPLCSAARHSTAGQVTLSIATGPHYTQDPSSDHTTPHQPYPALPFSSDFYLTSGSTHIMKMYIRDKIVPDYEFKGPR